MAVNWIAPVEEQLFPVDGVRIGCAQAGIRKKGRYDLTVFLLNESARAVGVFTQNRFCAAPVQVCREHLLNGQAIRAMVINTGNANAGTGQIGLTHARQTCSALASRLGISPQSVLPFSTGVIMESLPVDRVVAGLDSAIVSARSDQWLLGAQAIMTTDTVPKAASIKITLGGMPVVVTGISKGAGMIRPNMATMLGFIATDACVEPGLMQAMLQEAADQSFNRITVDGDTSTNDSLVFVATNRAGNPIISQSDAPDAVTLRRAICHVAQTLAQAIVRDGEGATKFIAVTVAGGRDSQECLRVAYAIAHSPLVKTAFFASDPNLGRILAAVGYAGIEDLDQSQIELFLDDVHVVSGGGRHPAYREEDGQRVMTQSEITIRVDLARGRCAETVWTCDLSHDYVTINADYRS